MITAYRTSQVVRTAATLSLAEHCADGPVTASALAAAERTDTLATARVLRACAAIGLVTTQDEHEFLGTELLDTLRRDADGSQWGFALSLTAPGHWGPWGDLPEAVRSGRNEAARSIGSDVFQYYATHEEEGARFFEGMAGLMAAAGAEAARVMDTSDWRVAVDVGGATGSLLHDLMALNRELQGIVYDIPAVAEQAAETARRLSLDDRVRTVGGDFFKSVPEGADAYLLRFILHDWDDARCVDILRNCRQAMAPGARLYVLEMVLGTIGREASIVPMQDLNMLVELHGRERSIPEFDELFAAAGLRRVEVTATESPISIIAAIAA